MSGLEISLFIWQLFAIYVVIAFIKICISATKFVIRSRKISNLLLGYKLRFFNILGHVSHLPLSKKSQNGFSLLVHAQQYLSGLAKVFPKEKLLHLWIFIFPVVILQKSEAVEVIFSSTETIERPWFYKWLQLFFGTGLLTSGGDMWRFHRRSLNKYFHKSFLKNHVPIINKQSRLLVESLKDEIHEDSTKISKPLSVCTLRTVYEIVFGIENEVEKSSESKEFIYAIKRGMIFIAERIMNCFHWLDFIYFSTKRGKELIKHSETVRNFARSKIQQRKQKILERDFNARETNERPLLDLLLELHFERTDFSEKDVADQLLTFIVAGHDTTKVSISWTLFMLGLYQDVQQKVHEELDLIFREDTERDATLLELNEMKYLKCVIKEALRLCPPALFLARQVHKDINICGYQIPSGTTCVALPYVLHRDEEVFPDAERFDPDRFLPENSRGRSAYAYIPFSAGPRNCIGHNLAMIEQMIILSTLLRSYKFESLDPRDKVLPAMTIVTSLSKSIRIRIRPRQKEKLMSVES